jgi:hypothetical protein
VPRVARGASRLCFCHVVLRDAVERKLRGTHRPHYVKSSSYGINATGLSLYTYGAALSALARSQSRVTIESTFDAGPPLAVVCRSRAISLMSSAARRALTLEERGVRWPREEGGSGICTRRVTT